MVGSRGERPRQARTTRGPQSGGVQEGVTARLRAREAARAEREGALCVIPLHSNLLLLASSSTAPASLAITPAEHEVATLAAAGWSNSLIAARRGSSPNTVANLLRSAYEKLGISGRRELRTLLLGPRR